MTNLYTPAWHSASAPGSVREQVNGTLQGSREPGRLKARAAAAADQGWLSPARGKRLLLPPAETGQPGSGPGVD